MNLPLAPRSPYLPLRRNSTCLLRMNLNAMRCSTSHSQDRARTLRAFSDVADTWTFQPCAGS